MTYKTQAIRDPKMDRIRSIVALYRAKMPDSALAWAVDACGQIDVFETVAEGSITAEEGAWLLSLQRREKPWYVRLAMWVWRNSDE